VRVLERDKTGSSSLSRLVVMVAVAVLAVGAISCGTSHPRATSTTKPSTISITTATSSSTTSTTPVTTGFSLYFLRGNYLGVAHRSTPLTGTISASALSALVDGPDVAESAVGLSSAIPIGTKVLGLQTSSGMATVDFNGVFSTPGTPGAELDRVAQVVYTLTQFPSVTHVVFEISGSTPVTFASGAISLSQPLGRNDVLGALPAILVETPAVGDSLHGAVHLSGLANVFEAQFNMQLVSADGRVLVDQPVHATAGSGTWGTFDVTLPFTVAAASSSTLRIYDTSMKDGSPIDEVDLHLPIAP